MIQRIQSIFLVLATMLSILMLEGNIVTLSSGADTSFFINFKGVNQSSGEGGLVQIHNGIPLIILIVLISVLSAAAIFLYKNRQIQMKLTQGAIIVSVLLTGLLIIYTISLISKYGATLIPGVRMFFPVLILVFELLAYRSIKKDEDLVKSLDRLR